MASETIRVPVKLEVLLESIDSLRKILDTILPNTAKWKELSTILASMEKMSKELGIAMNKPFGSLSDFNAALKGINKIDDALSKMRISISSIKFSDLKLDVNQSAQFEQLKAEFRAIENEVNNFKALIKSSLQLDTDLWAGILNLDPNALTHSFDEIIKAVLTKVASLKREYDKAKESFDNFLMLQAKAENTKKLFSSDKLLLKNGLDADIFSKFFRENKDGDLAFKSGLKKPFYEWMQKNLQLTGSELKELLDLSASELLKALASLNVNKILDRVNKTLTTGLEKLTKVNTAQSEMEKAQGVMGQLKDSIDLVETKEASMTERTTSAENALRAFCERLAEAARNSSSFNSSSDLMRSRLEQLRATVSSANAQFLRMERTVSLFNAIKMAVVNFMGFRQTLNLVKKAATEAFNHIKELDTVMNKISIVTNMDTSDLWKLISAYSEMAQTYGTSIKGAYEVSLIYYQQGLQTNDVLTLTNETLKLSKISGLDYATTTDYMTTALRGFKMEMSDASTVVDVYSNLAAHTAASSDEIAIAMSKTASSMESVGATFQETSAMIATMVAVTRESATNIGSALKSIAARYGEMKQDPLALDEVEGEAVAYNKVDAALQSVGISLKDTNGQFRNITDVILELSDVWDLLESTQLRYIATQFAGNRQQSRFLALVSNKDLLKANLEYAEDSEDTGSILALKALDSIETKIELVKVAYQQFYTSAGAENIFKGALDGIKEYINWLNKLPKIGLIPVGAITMIMNLLDLLKTSAIHAIDNIATIFRDKFLDMGKTDIGESLFDRWLDHMREKHADIKGEAQSIRKDVDEALTLSGASSAKVVADVNKTRKTADAAGEVSTPEKPATVAATEKVKNETSAELIVSATELAPVVVPVEPLFNYDAFYDRLITMVDENEALNIPLTAAIDLSSSLNLIDSEFMSKLSEGMKNINFDSPEASALVLALIEKLIADAGELGPKLRDEFIKGGKDGIAGLIIGLSNSDGASGAAERVGAEVIVGLKKGLDEHSPSEEAAEAGRLVVAGLSQGILSAIDEAKAVATEAGTSVLEALKDSLKKVDIDFSSLFTFGTEGMDLSLMSEEELIGLLKQVLEKAETIRRGIKLSPQQYTPILDKEKRNRISEIRLMGELERALALAEFDNNAQVQEYLASNPAYLQAKNERNRAGLTIQTLGYVYDKQSKKWHKDEKLYQEAIELSAYEKEQQALKEAGYYALDDKIKERELANRGHEGEPIFSLEEIAELKKQRDAINTSVTARRGEFREQAQKETDARIRENFGIYARNETYIRKNSQNHKTLEAAYNAAESKRATLIGSSKTAQKEAIQAVEDQFSKVTPSQMPDIITAAETRTLDQIQTALTPKVLARQTKEAEAREKAAAEQEAEQARVKKEIAEEEARRAEEKEQRRLQEEAEKAQKVKDQQTAYLTKSGFTSEAIGQMTDDLRSAAFDAALNYVSLLRRKNGSYLYEDTAQEWLGRRMLALGSEGLLSGKWQQELETRAKSAWQGRLDEGAITEVANPNFNFTALHLPTLDLTPEELTPELKLAGYLEGLALATEAKRVAKDREISDLNFEYTRKKDAIEGEYGGVKGLFKKSEKELRLAALEAERQEKVAPLEKEKSRLSTERMQFHDLSRAAMRAASDRKWEHGDRNTLLTDEEEKIIKGYTEQAKGITNPENFFGITRENVIGLIEGQLPTTLPLTPTTEAFLTTPEVVEKLDTSEVIEEAKEAKELVEADLPLVEEQGNAEPVVEAAKEAKELAESEPPKVELEGNAEPIVEATEKAADEVSGKNPTVTVDANTGPAKEKTEKLADDINNTDTTVTVNSTQGSETPLPETPAPVGELPKESLLEPTPTPAPVPADNGAAEALGNLKDKVDETTESIERLGTQGETATRKVADGANQAADAMNKSSEGAKKATKSSSQWGSAIGSAMSTIAGLIPKTTQAGEAAAAAITIVGGAIKAAMSTGPMAIVTGIMTAITGIIALVKSFSLDSLIERAKKQAEELGNKAKLAKADVKTLETGKKKLEELEKTRYESAEAAEEYLKLVDSLTSAFPELISGFDEAGNAIITTTSMEETLAAAREKSARATYNAVKAEEIAAEKEEEKARGEATSALNDVSSKLMENAHNKGQYGAAGTLSTMVDEETAKQGLRNLYTAAGLEDPFTGAELKFNKDYFNKNIVNAIAFANGAGGLSRDTRDWSYANRGAATGEHLIKYLEERANNGVELTDTEKALIQAYYGFENYNEEEMLSKDSSELQDLDLVSTVNAMKEGINSGDFDQARAKARELRILLSNLNKLLKLLEKDKTDLIITEEEYNARLEELTKTNALISKAMTAYDEYETKASTTKMTNKKLATSFFNSEFSTASFVTDKSGLASILGANYGADYDTARKVALADDIYYTWDDYETVMQSEMLEVGVAADTFWTELIALGDARKEKFTAMISKIDTYRKSDFDKEFSDLESWSGISGELNKSIDRRIAEVQSNLTYFYDLLAQDKSYGLDKWSDEQKWFTSDWKHLVETAETSLESNFLKTIFKLRLKLELHGYTQEAKDYGTAAKSLYTSITTGLSADVRNSVWDYIDKYGLTTREGIDKIIEEIEASDTKEDDALLKPLKELKETLQTNLSLAISSELSEFTTNWQNNSKKMKSLSTGIDLADVNSIINSTAGKNAGITLDSFKMDGDKLVLSAENAQKYIDEYLNQEREFIRTSGESLDNIATTFGNLDEEGNWKVDTEKYTVGHVFSHDEKTSLESILGGMGSLDLYLDSLGKLSADKTEQFYTDLEKAYKTTSDNLKEYNYLVEWSAEQIEKTLAWGQGNYSSLKKIYEQLYGEGYDYQERLDKLVSGAEQMTAEELEFPDIASAVKLVRTAYGTYINDLINKDIKTLYAKDYVAIGFGEEIIQELMKEALTYTTEEFAFWIGSLAKTAGLTLTELNDAFVKAWNKNHSKETIDGLKDVLFLSDEYFSATTDLLKTFADTYGLSITDLLEKGLAMYDETTDSWIVKYKELDEQYTDIDFSKISQFLSIVTDSINKFFTTLSGLIENALNGSLSNMDAENLITLANEIGLTLSKQDFTLTAEGLKLSETAAINLYYRLKDIDVMRSKLVFDKLNESLLKSNDNFKTTSALASHVYKIRNNIYENDGKTSLARLKLYKAELQIAEEILEARATSEDSSMNFMSNKIPGGLNNPLNYFNNWSLALQKLLTAMNTSSKNSTGRHKGLIDYQDWYNIVMEMNNIALLGEEFEVAGVKLDGSMEAAAALIEKGAAALTTTDTGEIKVALGDIGVNFEAGSGEMSQGITTGINAMAKSQVKMLDGLIALLEVIVQMEGLSEIAGDDMQLDLGDIFAGITEGADESEIDFAKVTKWSENYKRAVEKIKEAVDGNSDLEKTFKHTKMKFGSDNFSLYDMIDTSEAMFEKLFPSNFTAELKANAMKSYLKFMNGMYLMAMSGEWDTDNVYDSLKKLAALYDLDISDFSFDIFDKNGRIERTIILLGDTEIEIEWLNLNVQKVLKLLKKDKGKTEQEAEEIVTQANKDYAGGKGVTGDLTINDIMYMKHGTIFKKDKNNEYYIEIDGQTYKAGTHQFNNAVKAQALRDAGVKPNDFDATANEEIEVTGEVVFNLKTLAKAIVTVGADGGLQWQFDDAQYGTIKGNTREELYDAYVRKVLGRNEDQEITLEEKLVTLYEHLGIDYKFEATTYHGNKKITNDSALAQKAIRDWLDTNTNLTQGTGENLYQIEGKKLKVKLSSGVTLELDATQFEIELDGEIITDDEAVSSYVKGLYQSTLVDQISDGIVAALGKAGVSLDNLNVTFSTITPTGDIVVSDIAEATGTITHLVATVTSVDADGNITGVEITGQLDNTPIKVVIDKTSAKGDIDELKKYIATSPEPIKITFNPDTTAITEALKGPFTALVTLHGNPDWTGGGDDNQGKTPNEATGNVGLAKATGTLMGELGPELVVSNGRYFVAGQNGPEMVDLADDAIVFNHLLTRSLLKKGTSSTRGKAVTNEQNAVSYAKGNINGGPAHAGASAALAALKQLRAQWKALESLTAQDLAGKGGGGGGGGGDPKAFIKELEKWYNWLQLIAKLEKDINLEETRRSKILSDMYAHGLDYYKSQKASLEAIKLTLVVQDSLAKSQEAYFNQRREELNKLSAFSSLYKFSESGQLYYQPGALEWLSDLSGRNATTGEANYTAKEQYEKLVAAGYGFAMKYDSSGNEIKQEGTDWYSTALQAFWDKIDADKEEMLSLHDSVEDAKNNVLQNQEAMNQILRDIEDNQIAVEQKVLKAVEESRLRAIDDAQEQRDALEEASNNVINGLSKQLQKEQEMYSLQQEVDELSKLQRQLAILLSSGGSASLIADLQQLIAEKLQDMYFDMQQKLIDALQEASDNELERLDHQIDIMTETLEYEKENGLLWNQVYEVLLGNPQDIADFIQKNTSEYWGLSPTEWAKNVREDLFEILRFKEFQEDTSDIRNLLHEAFNIEDAKSEQKEKLTNYIKGLYQELFGREADEGGLAYWLELMAAGMSEEDVRLGFMNSAEYKKLKGITDTSTTNTATASTNTLSNSKNKNNSLPVYGYYDGKLFKVVKLSDEEKKKLKKGEKVQRGNYDIRLYAKGGMNYNTGLAWLDGTDKEPEAIFNAEQTKILRENILSSRPDSLVSLLKSYKEAYHGLSASTYDSISNNNNNSTIIERAEVNLQVAQLANDYDSKRAANTIMDEMLRIASKTSANNSVRR